MGTCFIVFARLDSRRLPGKALKDLAGRPLLARVVERVCAAAQGRPVVVATSDRPVDDPIAELARGLGVGVFRGSVDDVAGRALACAEANDADRFVRICGDSPFMDPELCRRMVDIAEAEPFDLVTNLAPRSFPPGCSVEVIATKAMHSVCGATVIADDREHVTRWIYANPAKFSIRNVAANRCLEPVRLTVDTEEELDRARRIFAAAGGDVGHLSIDEIVAIALTLDGTERKEHP